VETEVVPVVALGHVATIEIVLDIVVMPEVVGGVKESAPHLPAVSN